jgi:hypothetical protein
MRTLGHLPVWGCLLWATLLSPLLCAAKPVEIAKEGKALLPVIVSESASEKVRSTATLLAAHLHAISGGTFSLVSPQNLSAGIWVGLGSDFSEFPEARSLSMDGIAQREDYLLHSQSGRLLILGNTASAVESAVWDVLYRLGYRQFFPGKVWEVVPQSATLELEVDTKGSPSYHARKIWPGYGLLKERTSDFEDWSRKNRVLSGIDLRSGHSYEGILHKHKKQFELHPEYLALVGGTRRGPKLCISNPSLRALVVDDALEEMARNPAADSISRDPSDGGGWCECQPCAQLGSITDRALLLANETAEAVTRAYPGRLVGIYGYGEHSPPPTIQGHPGVVVSVATAFIHGGFTMDQLLSGWSRRVRTLGIREYYSVNTWDRDLPGAARGGNLEYLSKTIPEFHRAGARFLSAESSDNFGPNGLGYYIAARLLWDVREADRVDALVEDFLVRAFGEAREPMREFYGFLNGARKRLLCDDLVGRMYRNLQDALRMAATEDVRRRIEHLALYTRHVELYLDYSSESGPARQAAYEKLIRHAWRIRDSGMVHTLALYRDLSRRDKSLVVPPSADWRAPEKNNPWKQDPPYTTAEIGEFIAAGITARPLMDFETTSFSENLVPAAPLGLQSGERGNMGFCLRGVRNLWTWSHRSPAEWSLSATGGIIYNNRGDAHLSVYPAAELEGKSVQTVSLVPDKTRRDVRLNTRFEGLHRIEISDGAAGTQLEWPAGTPMTVSCSLDKPPRMQGRWTLYFYVPKHTPFVGGFAQGVGDLLDPEGRKIFSFTGKGEYFKVPVPSGADGRLWRFSNCTGDRLLMTVPAYMAASAAELLLPKEVVDRDKP